MFIILSDIILNFARSHDNNIARKEFMTWYSQEFPNRSLGSIDVTLQNLVKNGILTRSGYGMFQISSTTKPEFRYTISDTETKLYSQIKELYPYTNLCIWNAQALSSFMQHIPNVDTIIIETERIATEPVYEDVRRFAEGRVVLLKPKEREYHLYAAGSPAIIIKDYITEAPIVTINDITTSSLEKILVDATIAPELEFARGSEIYHINANAAEMYRINKKMMLRYATRRGKKEEIEKLINTTMP